MKQYRPEFEFSRPAPFPVYPEDGRRLWLARAPRILGLLIVAVLLLPGISQPFSPLIIPVFYDRVDLEQRSPVALKLDLPNAEYQVSPAGLGYFEGDRFIYTADVSRGLIYGRSRKGVVAIELNAPQREPVYMEERLERIRRHVVNINDIKNRLRLRRLSFEEGRNSFEEGVDGVWNDRRGETGIPSVEDMALEMQRLYPSRELEAARVLSDRSYNIAELKQLWYESQFARLDLLVEQFDLQLGLAELPRQQFDELLSLGNDQLVRETMLGEIERLRNAWFERRSILELEMANDLKLVNETAAAAGSIVALASPLSLTVPDDAASRMSPDSRSELLLVSLAQTRTRVANSEWEMIQRGMQKLDDAKRHVQAGVLPSWTEIREIAVAPVRLELPAIEELDLFSRVGNTAVDPQNARDLLLELNRSFEADLNRDLGEFSMSWGGDLENRELGAHELAYGLLAVDSSTRSSAAAGLRGTGGVMLPQLLEDILESPQGYDVSQYELGYLRFMKWYAELDPDDEYRPLKTSPRRNFGR